MKTRLAAVAGLAVLGLSAMANAQTFSNPTPITIPDAGTLPFPSSIVVAGVPAGGALDINVNFFDLSHTFPDDLDILLTGPGGFSVMLMSDTGGGLDIVNIDLTFSDGSPALSDSGQLVSGIFAPTNIGAVDPMDPPAPVGPYGTTLNSFGAGSPDGTWNLWAVDDLGADIGSMAGGWSITFAIPSPGALALLGLVGLVGGRRRRA